MLQTVSTGFKAASQQCRSSNENSQKPVVFGEERTDEGAQPSSGTRQELLFSAEGESPRGRRRLETGLVRGSVFQGRLQQARSASVRKHVS